MDELKDDDTKSNEFASHAAAVFRKNEKLFQVFFLKKKIIMKKKEKCDLLILVVFLGLFRWNS